MNIFELFGTIAVNNSNANKAISQTGKMANNLAHTVNVAFEKVGKFAINCGKTVAKGLAVGATAMTALVGKGLGLAGELEQNMGGSEAVFKQFASTMQRTAQEAYKNMGLSQSNYLATANKMGALFQGVGYSIEDSANITMMAMQRAADVASIMGIDVSVAMESIAGAAKGNFTMMDNLGVAINDTALANYALSQGITTSTAKMSTQEKVALAMQLFLEKTAYAAGNYAKENETLAGSLTTAKAAFQNFLSGAGDADALADALVNAGDVITNNLNKLLPKLTKGMGTLITKLTPKLPELIRNALPGIIDGTVSLLSGLAVALPDLFSIIADELPGIMDRLSNAFATVFPKVAYALREAFSDLAGNLPSMLKNIGKVAESVWSHGVWPLIQDLFKVAFNIELPKWHLFKAELRKKWDESGIEDWFNEKLSNVGSFISDAFDWFIENDVDLETALGIIATAFTAIGLAIDPVGTTIGLIVSGMTYIIGNWDKFKKKIGSGEEQSMNPKDAIDVVNQAYGINVDRSDPYSSPGIEMFNDPETGLDSKPFMGKAKKLMDQLWTGMDEAMANMDATSYEKYAAQIRAFIDAWNAGMRGDELQKAVDEAAENLKSVIPTTMDVESASKDAQTYLDNHPLTQDVNLSYRNKTTLKPGFLLPGDLDGSHASGLDFVPKDGYRAELHYGEAVLTRKQADAWRKGGGNAQLVAEMREMRETFIQALDAVRSQPLAINVDSRTAAVLMAKEMSRSIGNRNIQTLMGMGG